MSFLISILQMYFWNINVMVVLYRRKIYEFYLGYYTSGAKEGKEKSDLFFWQAQDYSPYYEQSFNTINEEHIDKNLIEINALYRFSHIFQEILHPNFIQNGQYVDVIAFIIYLFDTVIHYLGEIDLRHGFTKREFYIRRICYEVKTVFLARQHKMGF